MPVGLVCMEGRREPVTSEGISMMGRWRPLTAVCLGTFMLLIDVNIVTVALPDMARDLGTSFGGLQWVLDVYALALASLLVGAGAIADRIGRRRLYLTGTVVFALASLACALAGNTALLITARAVQGCGAAAMFATTVALVNASYQGRDRSLALGVWVAVSGAASGIGPILGGLLTELAGWRWIFLVNLPVSAVAIVMTLRSVHESRDPSARPVDLPGVALFAIAAAALTYGLTRGAEDGWADAVTVGAFAVTVAALAAFAVVQLRSAHPLLDIDLLRQRAFVGVLIASLTMSGAAFASLLFTSLWLQTVLGLTAMAAGLVMLPLPAAAFITSLLGGRLLHRVPARWTAGIGLALIGAGGLAQTALDADSNWPVLLPGLVIIGIGAGLALPAVTGAALAAVPAERGGMASGAVNALRQLGYALAVAGLGAAFHSGAADTSTRSGFATGLDAAYTTAGVIALAGAVVVVLSRPRHALVAQTAGDRAYPKQSSKPTGTHAPTAVDVTPRRP
ncbi:MFS transporter [Saccharopolyspora sp. 5N708]|uniref:MFS transporter n=1 Tax=Saccharopolyspora sp. 5N708 TaxID=3457424 RepID=UPI003FD1DCAC